MRRRGSAWYTDTNLAHTNTQQRWLLSKNTGGWIAVWVCILWHIVCQAFSGALWDMRTADVTVSAVGWDFTCFLWFFTTRVTEEVKNALAPGVTQVSLRNTEDGPVQKYIHVGCKSPFDHCFMTLQSSPCSAQVKKLWHRKGISLKRNYVNYSMYLFVKLDCFDYTTKQHCVFVCLWVCPTSHSEIPHMVIWWRALASNIAFNVGMCGLPWCCGPAPQLLWLRHTGCFEPGNLTNKVPSTNLHSHLMSIWQT